MHKRKQINTTLGDLIVAVSDAVYPLAKTGEAIKALSNRKVMGKLLLRP